MTTTTLECRVAAVSLSANPVHPGRRLSTASTTTRMTSTLIETSSSPAAKNNMLPLIDRPAPRAKASAVRPKIREAIRARTSVARPSYPLPELWRVVEEPVDELGCEVDASGTVGVHLLRPVVVGMRVGGVERRGDPPEPPADGGAHRRQPPPEVGEGALGVRHDEGSRSVRRGYNGGDDDGTGRPNDVAAPIREASPRSRSAAGLAEEPVRKDVGHEVDNRSGERDEHDAADRHRPQRVAVAANPTTRTTFWCRSDIGSDGV
jgi:hypothetical protein